MIAITEHKIFKRIQGYMLFLTVSENISNECVFWNIPISSFTIECANMKQG